MLPPSNKALGRDALESNKEPGLYYSIYSNTTND